MEGRPTTNTREANSKRDRQTDLRHLNCGNSLASSELAAIGTSTPFLFIMNYTFTDNPQIEEVMYWNDESISEFLDEQGDIMGMNIECNEFDTDMTV